MSMSDAKETQVITRRGQHVRAWRKAGLFDHHGIVIADTDLERIEPGIRPDNIEPVMVAEQNTCGLRIVYCPRILH